jgi:hypothetical protein
MMNSGAETSKWQALREALACCEQAQKNDSISPVSQLKVAEPLRVQENQQTIGALIGWRQSWWHFNGASHGDLSDWLWAK